MHKVIEVCSEHLNAPEQTVDVAAVRKKMYKGKEELVTIVIFAYGRLEKTRNCVESVLKYTEGISYKLLLIDNGSPEDDVFRYFQSVKHDNTVILHVNKNVGGSFANNKGEKLAESEFYVLLNNDVIVTKDWLKNLLTCAQSDENIGMVCPVCTNVTWEQLETLGGFSNEEEMQEKAAAFNISNPKKWEERTRLVPLVALYRTECFDLAGGFDMGYLHNFGDDDHCFRIRRAGYKLVLCRDVFIHHDHIRDSAVMQGEEGAEIVLSRAAFQNKFHGIDAWDDTQNVIAPYIQNLEVFDDGQVNILAFESRCGTPILDIKNLCKWSGIEQINICAVTEKLIYYPDLESVSDEVLSGSIRDILEEKDGEKFSFIYCGKEMNLYDKPLELLKKLVGRVKKDGYLIFTLRNTYDYRNFLQTVGVGNLKDEDYPVQIPFMDVITYLQSEGINIEGAYKVPHYVNDELRSCIEKALSGIGGENEINDIIDKLLIRNFVIVAKR